jgi:hypothetical protein
MDGEASPPYAEVTSHSGDRGNYNFYMEPRVGKDVGANPPATRISGQVLHLERKPVMQLADIQSRKQRGQNSRGRL